MAGTYRSEYTGAQIDASVAFGHNPDSTPTANSVRGVTSGGVKAAIDAATVQVDDTLTIQGAAADAKATGDAIGEVHSTLDYLGEKTRNLWEYGDQSFTTSKTITLSAPLAPGTYALSAIVTSEDTSASRCRVQFYDGTTALTAYISRGTTRKSVTVTTGITATQIIFYASDTPAHSGGDSASFTDIMLETGSSASSYVPPYTALDINARNEANSNSDKIAKINYENSGIIDLFGSLTEYTNGYYMNNLGAATEGDNFRYSGNIYIGYCNRLKCKCSLNGSGLSNKGIFINADSSTTAISEIAGGSSVAEYDIAIPPNARFVILNSLISGDAGNYAFLYYSVGEADIHTVNILGDSITYGVGASDNAHRYANLLGVFSKVTVNNYGVSSSKISEIPGDTRDSFVERIANMDTSADMVVIFGGTNDYWHQETEIGQPDSNDTATLCGALNYILPYLLTNYPDKQYLVVTPYQQYSQSLGGNSDTDFGYGTMQDFVDAIIERAEHYSIPVLDLFRMSGMDMAHNAVSRTTFGNSASDCIHPNNAGHNLIARLISRYINGIIWKN